MYQGGTVDKVKYHVPSFVKDSLDIATIIIQLLGMDIEVARSESCRSIHVSTPENQLIPNNHDMWSTLIIHARGSRVKFTIPVICLHVNFSSSLQVLFG